MLLQLTKIVRLLIRFSHISSKKNIVYISNNYKGIIKWDIGLIARASVSTRGASCRHLTPLFSSERPELEPRASKKINNLREDQNDLPPPPALSGWTPSQPWSGGNTGKGIILQIFSVKIEPTIYNVCTCLKLWPSLPSLSLLFLYVQMCTPTMRMTWFWIPSSRSTWLTLAST